MPPIFCGNNALDRRLQSGEYILGTRYRCLRKGIGQGLNLPVDNTYSGDYVPIDDRKIYCGNRENIPENYDYAGNLPQCLQIGVGIGKRINAERYMHRPRFWRTRKGKFILFLILFLIIGSGIFSLLYFLKPSFILNKNQDEDKNKETIEKIDWKNFSILYGILMFIVILVLYNIIWT